MKTIYERIEEKCKKAKNEIDHPYEKISKRKLNKIAKEKTDQPLKEEMGAPVSDEIVEET